MARKPVLIIDDSRDTQQLLAEQVLEPSGYWPLVASDGEEGIRRVLHEHPALIILGMQLPETNGLEVLQALRRRNVETPVIFVAAGDSAESVVRAFRLGARDCVIKPFSPQEMQEVIQRVLDTPPVFEKPDQLPQQLVEVNQPLQGLEPALEGAQDAIIIVDEDDAVLLFNAAARAALDLAETNLLHRSVPATIPHPALLSMFSQARETGRETRSEVPLEDGRTFNAQLTPIEGVGRVLVMQDITHLKEMDRVKSEFVTAVSHDLRTPLTTIQGYIELMPRAGPLTAQQQEFVRHVLQSLETITELVDNLLDSDRLEAGLDLEMGPCDLLQVIEQTIHDFHPRLDRKKQELRWDLPKTLPLVLGNRHRLRQVMDNLLNNALKYTQEGGWIAVSALEDNGHIVVHVADNGIGILPAQQPYIFDKFYRVESEETLRITGTGLGLAIVKTVIEKHKGRVWVESKSGEGSIFSFVLPALET